MPNMVRCEGCGNHINPENHSAIRTPKLGRVIGHVHKSPSPGSNLVHHCHLRAFRALQSDYPEIMIEGRLLDADVVAQAERMNMPRSVRSGTSGKYAAQQRGAPMIVSHIHTSTVPSSY